MISNFEIYLICNIDGFKAAFSAIGLILMVGANMFIVLWGVNEDWFEDKPELMKKILIAVNVAGIFFFTLALFLPNRETLIYMQVNKMLTQENINFAANQTKEIVDYIVQKIEEIGGAFK